MKKRRTLFFLMPICLILAASVFAQTNDLVRYIKPFIGTHGEGNVYPGPVAPHGMVQLGPDTDKRSWATASGYDYGDSVLIGFSMQHLSGTGIPDLGDFLMMPSVGKVELKPGTVRRSSKGERRRMRWVQDPDSGYSTPFSHDTEIAEAGYYSVFLPEHRVKVELAATERAGMLRFTFPKSDSSNIMMDLSHVLQWNVIWSHVRVEDKDLVTGYHLCNGWAQERRLHFAARYSRPFDEVAIMKNGRRVWYNTRRFTSMHEAYGKDIQYYTRYQTEENEVILMKVGISAVDEKNALLNLDTEIPHWDFDRVVAETRAKWNSEMQVLQVEGPQEQKETFYTALYHSLLTPTVYEDVDGRYRGLDKSIHTSDGYTSYGIFSLWDTYRALHPLYALINAERNVDMIRSMLDHYDQSVDQLLPIWSLNHTETWCMIGYHAVPVIADAIMKELPGLDVERAYEACKTTAMNPHYDSVKEYAEIGYVPFDHENESVSKTLEYAYDDFCIARMAHKLGKKEDYEYFTNRSKAYVNIFDPTTKLMRGKDSAGNWRTPFHPHGYIYDMAKRDITEGTNWQYTWYVPHDAKELVLLMGGKEAFATKLDTLFNYVKDGEMEDGSEDILGRFGEYWHGNEPAHHVAYLYNYADQPWKTQSLIRRIISTQYGNKPHSLCGNDDCGQMSAWYLFNCMGFYPSTPSSNIYVIGTPCAEKVTMRLAGGENFVARAKNYSEDNPYIQKVTLNGKVWNKTYVPYSAIKGGGTIVYEMGPVPNMQWGVGAEATPLRVE
ncbi:GH92 family glycosyl hydrolase [bacterium]|nr:GH92 family glycosyl hydrolase [bacterium]